MIALQGPSARAAARPAGCSPTLPSSGAAWPRSTWDGVPVRGVGHRLHGRGRRRGGRAGRAAAAAFWDAVLAAGFEPAGLGARDTLRLEAGLPLHGHELGPGITPLQAGLGWVVGWKKGAFRGRAALEAERERGVARRLRGLLVEGRRPPRDGSPVLVGGEAAGVVTSGNFSPDAGPGHRPRLPPARRRGGRRRSRSTSAAPTLPAKVVPTPFV